MPGHPQKGGIRLKPYRKVAAKRIKCGTGRERLGLRLKWGAEMAVGEVDVDSMLRADEKLPRLGACVGGNRNQVIWVKNVLKKDQVVATLTQREVRR